MTPSMTSREELPLADLPMFWEGRANALRILDSQRGQSDHATLEQAWTYDECAKELREALRTLPAQGPTWQGIEAELLVLHEWMREPDWAENFSFEDMANWINRRPTGITARLAALPSERKEDCNFPACKCAPEARCQEAKLRADRVLRALSPSERKEGEG
jgi:hypothetical protein